MWIICPSSRRKRLHAAAGWERIVDREGQALVGVVLDAGDHRGKRRRAADAK